MGVSEDDRDHRMHLFAGEKSTGAYLSILTYKNAPSSQASCTFRAKPNLGGGVGKPFSVPISMTQITDWLCWFPVRCFA